MSCNRSKPTEFPWSPTSEIVQTPAWGGGPGVVELDVTRTWKYRKITIEIVRRTQRFCLFYLRLRFSNTACPNQSGSRSISEIAQKKSLRFTRATTILAIFIACAPLSCLLLNQKRPNNQARREVVEDIQGLGAESQKMPLSWLSSPGLIFDLIFTLYLITCFSNNVVRAKGAEVSPNFNNIITF